MMEAYALAAVALLAAGAVVGFLALLALGIRRDRVMTEPASGRLTRGARAANGVTVRLYGTTRDASLHRQDYLLASHEVDVIT
jgi:hypothetical protein